MLRKATSSLLRTIRMVRRNGAPLSYQINVPKNHSCAAKTYGERQKHPLAD